MELKIDILLETTHFNQICYLPSSNIESTMKMKSIVCIQLKDKVESLKNCKYAAHRAGFLNSGEEFYY